MVALFYDYYKVRYAPRGTASWVFYALCLLLVVALPLVISFVTHNFLWHTRYFAELPTVVFTQNCALRVTTVLGKELLWTCSEVFNDKFLVGDERQVVPHFSILEDDRTNDGKTDIITMEISIPVNKDLNASIYDQPVMLPEDAVLDAVQEVHFLPEFSYVIKHSAVKMDMTVAPLLTFTNSRWRDASLVESTANGPSVYSSSPLCARTEADMVFHSTESLRPSSKSADIRRYSGSPFVELVKQPADLMNLPYFARHYTARNHSVMLRTFIEASGGLDLLNDLSTPYLWNDLDLLNAFTWRIVLRIPKAQGAYVASVAELVKWAWVQFFCIAYVIQWFLWKVRGVLTKSGVLTSAAFFSVRHGK